MAIAETNHQKNPSGIYILQIGRELKKKLDNRWSIEDCP